MAFEPQGFCLCRNGFWPWFRRFLDASCLTVRLCGLLRYSTYPIRPRRLQSVKWTSSDTQLPQITLPFVCKATTPGTMVRKVGGILTFCIQGHHAGYNWCNFLKSPYHLYARPPRRVQLVDFLPYTYIAKSPYHLLHGHHIFFTIFLLVFFSTNYLVIMTDTLFPFFRLLSQWVLARWRFLMRSAVFVNNFLWLWY